MMNHLKLVLALVFSLAAVPAFAHPHVWVTMESELVYAPDGSITGIRHAWTFDDVFSTYATQGDCRRRPKDSSPAKSWRRLPKRTSSR